MCVAMQFLSREHCIAHNARFIATRNICSIPAHLREITDAMGNMPLASQIHVTEQTLVVCASPCLRVAIIVQLRSVRTLFVIAQ